MKGAGDAELMAFGKVLNCFGFLVAALAVADAQSPLGVGVDRATFVELAGVVYDRVRGALAARVQS